MTDEAYTPYTPPSVDGPPWLQVVGLCLVAGIAIFWIANALAKSKEKEAPTPKVASVKSAIPGEKSTKVRCFHCQHVQQVPVSVSSYGCEECGQKLKRKTAS
jgi:ABC-type nickel/cobalt efflux system permease component RcnA